MRRRHRAHRHPHRRNRPAVPMSSKPQGKPRQRHPSRQGSRVSHHPCRWQRIRRVSTRRIYAAGRNQRRRRAHRHPRRRSRPAAPMFSKPQKRPRQRRRSRRSSRGRSIPQRLRHRWKIRRDSARTMCASGQNRNGHRAHQHLRHRNRPAAPMSSKPQKRAKQRHQTRWSSQKRSAQHRPYRRQKAHRASAQRIYAPGQNRNIRRAYQR